MICDPNRGAKILNDLRIAIAKARSVSLETLGDATTYALSPELDPKSLLNETLTRIDGKLPSWNTLCNILYLANKADYVVFAYTIYWQRDLPQRTDIDPYPGGEV